MGFGRGGDLNAGAERETELQALQRIPDDTEHRERPEQHHVECEDHCNTDEGIDRVQQGVVINIRRVIEAVVDLQKRPHDQDQQQQHDSTDFDKRPQPGIGLLDQYPRWN